MSAFPLLYFSYISIILFLYFFLSGWADLHLQPDRWDRGVDDASSVQPSWLAYQYRNYLFISFCWVSIYINSTWIIANIYHDL